MTPALPPVIGHRGVAGLAPENTLAGFRAARELGVQWVEFDVRLTGDRRAVLLHDERLDRTTDASGVLARLTLDEIAAADAGSWFGPRFSGEPVPTLEETLDLLLELGLGAVIELKADAGTEAELARTTAQIVGSVWPSDRPGPMVSSFSGAALAAFGPACPRGLLFGALPSDWRSQALACGATSVHCAHARLTRKRVAEARAAGFPVLAYTVNHAGRLAELSAWGVASVFSDRPDRLLDFARGTQSAIRDGR